MKSDSKASNICEGVRASHPFAFLEPQVCIGNCSEISAYDENEYKLLYASKKEGSGE